jgi:hypothetical protein
MARCETCSNDYDKAFEIILAGESRSRAKHIRCDSNRRGRL